MHALRRTALVLLVTLLATLTVAPAQGQEGSDDPAPAGDQAPPEGLGGRWAVQPAGGTEDGLRPNFAYNLAPGQRITDVVAISNLSDAEITFAIYAKDAYNTPIDAGFALQDDSEAPVGVGSWVTLGTNEYTLAPQTRVEVPFEIAVPEDAEPGDHAGGIIAADVEPVGQLDEDGVAVAVRQRIGSRIYVRVDGPINPVLEVTQLGVDHSMPIVPWITGRGDMTASYEVTNSGNVRLDPVATLEVTGIFGRSIRSFPPQSLPELLPGSSVIITQSFSGLPPVEPLTARVVVESLGGEVTASRSKGVFVWSWAVVILLLLLIAGLGYWWWRRRRENAAGDTDRRGPGGAHAKREVPASAAVLADSPADGTSRDEVGEPVAP